MGVFSSVQNLRNLVKEGLDYYRAHWRFLVGTVVTYFVLVFGVGVLLLLVPGGREFQQSFLKEVLGGFESTFPSLLGAPTPLMVIYIFLINLVLGTALYITLPGLLLFALAPVMVFYRAILWGIIFAPSEPLSILSALPTILSEGFGYVLAVVPSFRLGLSWLWPKKAFKGEQMSRKQAFRRAFSELGSAYVIVAIALLAAAIIEVGSIQVMRLLMGRP